MHVSIWIYSVICKTNITGNCTLMQFKLALCRRFIVLWVFKKKKKSASLLQLQLHRLRTRWYLCGPPPASWSGCTHLQGSRCSHTRSGYGHRGRLRPGWPHSAGPLSYTVGERRCGWRQCRCPGASQTPPTTT